MKIGEKFKYCRSEYEVVSVFQDNGKTFFVCKKRKKDGVYTYSNIFTFRINEENKKELFQHV